MKVNELKIFHLYTDEYAIFEYRGIDDGMYAFLECDIHESGTLYHIDPYFYTLFNSIEVSDLQPYTA